MRDRVLRAGFWRDPTIGRLSMTARLFYMATWALADDKGRMEYDPCIVRSAAFMFDGLALASIDRALKELVDARRVVIYEARFKRWLCVLRLIEHQPRSQARASKLPAPPREVLMAAGVSGKLADELLDDRPWKPAVKRVRAVDPVTVARVFGFWVETFGKRAHTVLSPKRRKAIEGRLAEGYSEEDMRAAILGCYSDPWYRGQNDRGQVYDDIELICRSAEKLERFRDAYTQKAAPGGGGDLFDRVTGG